MHTLLVYAHTQISILVVRLPSPSDIMYAVELGGQKFKTLGLLKHQ